VTTFNDVVERTRLRLMGATREQVNVLSSAIDNDDTALTFTYDTRFTAGARICIGLETMLAVGTGTSTATVIRGMEGSTAVAHAQGDHVFVNPTWTPNEIGQAANETLSALSSPSNGLFRIRSVDFDYTPSTSGYELAGLEDFLDVWRVRYNTPGPGDDWPIVRPDEWRVDQAADTTDFASGVQIVLDEGGYPGQKVRVSYYATFDPLVTLADDVTAVSGLHAEAHKLLALGAAINLLSGTEAQRAYTTTQADPRRAAEVPPRTAVSALVPLLEQYESWVREEAVRLLKRYPRAKT
jgi:hypothetical protein